MAKKSLMLIMGIVIVILLAAGYYLYTTSSAKTTQTPPPKSSTASKVFQKKDLKADLERALKLNFNSTKYYEDINIYIKQADKAKTAQDAYSNYLKAYTFVSKAYQDTKRSEYRTVLVQFRDFLKAFPMYKTSEVVIPK